MSFEDDILIERYLKGELNADEIQGFSERLASDQEFRDKVQLEKQLFETFNEDQWSTVQRSDDNEEFRAYKKLFQSEEVEILKKTLAQIGEEYRDDTQMNSKKRWFYYYGVAALLLLFLAIYITIKPSHSVESLYTNYLEASELPSLVSRDSSDNAIYKAEEFYLNKQYDKALDSYNELLKTTTNNKATLNLYKGVSEMQLNKFSDAESTFNNLIASESLDATKGHWYKALLYLKMKDADKASNVLEHIIKNDFFNHKKAKALLEKLEALKD